MASDIYDCIHQSVGVVWDTKILYNFQWMNRMSIALSQQIRSKRTWQFQFWASEYWIL